MHEAAWKLQFHNYTVKQAFGYHVLTILNVTQSFSSTSLITALDIYDTHWKK
jgi:hypothetical protein